MKKILSVVFAIFALSLIPTATVAQAWDEEQQAVWKYVAQSWVDDAARNGKWPSEYIHEDILSWSANWPAPRRAASIKKWSRFNDESNKTLIYELFPAAIAVVGDTAVVHYSVVTVTENHEGKRERENQGIMETLVRDGKDWKFLGLGSFEMDSDD